MFTPTSDYFTLKKNNNKKHNKKHNKKTHQQNKNTKKHTQNPTKQNKTRRKRKKTRKTPNYILFTICNYEIRIKLNNISTILNIHLHKNQPAVERSLFAYSWLICVSKCTDRNCDLCIINSSISCFREVIYQ